MHTTRLTLLLGAATVLVLHLASASAQPAVPKPQVKSYPNDVSKVPCSALRNNGDGSWTELASTADRLVFQGNVYGGAVATRLEKRCGVKRT